MDYKETIRDLRFLAKYVHEEFNELNTDEAMKRAATAIETLLAERDAAVFDIQKDCITCANSESNNSKHIPCEFMEVCRFAEHWQWRGPQKPLDIPQE